KIVCVLTRSIARSRSVTRVKFSVVMSMRILLWLICSTSVGLMCGGFASLMSLSNNCYCKPTAFSSLHVGQDWVRVNIPSEWGDRYGKRVDEWRLPEKEKDREIYIQMVGQDGAALLDAVWSEEAPGWMRSLPAVETLRRMWVQQFMVAEGAVLLRPSEDLPPSSIRITSPYDTQARFAYKRSTKWVGYK